MIAGVAGIESNFLIQSVPCIKEYSHPDLAAIMVFSECLCALEVLCVLLRYVCMHALACLCCIL